MRIHAHSMLCTFGLTLVISGCQPSDSSQMQDESTRAYNCQAIPACDAKAPDPGALRPFNGRKPAGQAWHRGHDQYFREGDTQWLIGKFNYGSLLARRNLIGEEVDIHVLRGCGTSWEKLGTSLTTDGGGTTIEGIPDDGGRLYFEIPADKQLGVGRHRVRMVVAGDHSATELFVEVVPEGVPLFVSDVDGTLTTAELAELGSTITGTIPQANDGAAEALKGLVNKGYRPVYLTARPELSVQRTREFVDVRSFPVGRVETSLSPLLGLLGDKAVEYKSEALQRLTDKGFEIAYVFGNTASDAEAYENAGIPAESRYFFKYNDKFGGQRIESYRELNEFASLEGVCE
ncbi:LNS2 domain-containing protein [Oligoflexus tunisiensis]|uniref:LNS2 domain-containing protein n=1 Tax=Oligoflexus tunisiensis TaxID=708132 RepID=UPI00114CFBAE|nr:HAD family acid phosphatase [Oligoflexus tunisiensis]